MRAIVIVAVVLGTAGAAAGAQDSLVAARDLYAAAAYEDALSTLSHVDKAAAPQIARQADEYRAFCLFALGRTGEAETIAESLIRKEPLARLDAVDASPRVEGMFADVRKRLLPSLIRERFRTARSALDDKQFNEAEPPLSEARLMIDEAQALGVRDDTLADLSVLVDGFLQLIRSTADQHASLESASGVPAGGAASRAGAPAAAPVSSDPRAGFAAATATNFTSGSKVYSIGDDGVAPAVALRQRMPAMATELMTITRSSKRNAMLDLLIDETGGVVSATMRESLNSSFDALILRAARTWKYRPAVKDGVPVRYLKTLVLVP